MAVPSQFRNRSLVDADMFPNSRRIEMDRLWGAALEVVDEVVACLLCHKVLAEVYSTRYNAVVWCREEVADF